jgi:ArsR family transcriptional regulator
MQERQTMPIPNITELKMLHENMCQAVGDPRRIQILYAISDKRRNVTELSEALEVPQPTVSRHLAVLRQRGLVNAERDGSSVYYTLSDPRIIDVLDMMRQMMRDVLDRRSDVLEYSGIDGS